MTKCPSIWINLNDPVDVAWLARSTAKKIDGTLGFGREFCGFESWDKRVPAHQYYCRVCDEVFAGERRQSDLMREHLRSHLNSRSSASGCAHE